MKLLILNYKELWRSFDTVITRNALSFILVMTFISFAVFIASLPLLFFLNSKFPAQNIQENYGKFEFFILAVFVAPVVETFLFQFIPIETLQKKVNSKFIIAIISALLFSISHLSSYTYAFSNLLGGIVLAYTYIISTQKKYPAYLCTATVHSLRNLIVFVASLVIPE
jgi:hypothetical protein